MPKNDGLQPAATSSLVVLDAAPGSHVPHPEDDKPLPAAMPLLVVLDTMPKSRVSQPEDGKPLPHLTALDAMLGSHVQPPAVVLSPLIGDQTPPLSRVDHRAGGYQIGPTLDLPW